ncbi:hypothetical protein JM658_16085 [Joostella atrarenae]|uniref:Peptidase S9 prolyl oligopeptidase catalytic domain-containing protein n=1 Tax=Joostella atrarenae TaxID=679257 RepID=A0ABS9J7E4_9FLAO|nr:hypothetical protein [Joostella atrarenae]MCF8716350.1 hypothetical protein [Joostella atrarenae]
MTTHKFSLLSILLFILSYLSISCRNHTPIQNIPNDINSQFVYSKKSNQLFYSSNDSNLYHIYQLDLSKTHFKKKLIKIPLKEDVFVRDISYNGRFLSFVSDYNGNQKYDIYLYDLKNHKYISITSTIEIDDGNPQFSPTEDKLAYLSDGKLIIYDIQKHQALYKSDETFKSLLWTKNKIYLEKVNSDIVALDPKFYSFSKIWESPKESFVPKMFFFKDDSLCFISDHDGFSQIFILNTIKSKTNNPIQLNYDLYEPQLDHNGSLHFIANMDGSLKKFKLNKNNQIIPDINFEDGVLYQYYIDKNREIYLSASIDSPKSIYLKFNSKLKKLPINDHKIKASNYQRFITKDGMSHFIFTPKDTMKIKDYVVWLHGGPNEQVSPRYNPIINSLNEKGYGVICINYKGSTGIGNSYEMRDNNGTKTYINQIKNIKKNLNYISKMLNHKAKLKFISVSYGSILAHGYTAIYPNEVSKIVDISGLTDTKINSLINDVPSTLKILFISGDNDFALNQYKLDLIEKYDDAKTEQLIIEKEGHYIRRKNSLIKLINRTINFLD